MDMVLSSWEVEMRMQSRCWNVGLFRCDAGVEKKRASMAPKQFRIKCSKATSILSLSSFTVTFIELEEGFAMTLALVLASFGGGGASADWRMVTSGWEIG